MKKTAKLIEKLIRLANGDALPASSLKGTWFEQMQNDGILLATAHGSRKSFRASDGMILGLVLAVPVVISFVEHHAATVGVDVVAGSVGPDFTGLDGAFFARQGQR